MKLTEEQLSKLSNVLKVQKPCPNCGTTEDPVLLPDEYILTSIDRNDSSYSIGGPMSFIPLASIFCPKCGYTRLFNLKILGIVKN